MKELGVSFMEPKCDAGIGDASCLPLQTSLSARPSAAIVGDDPAPVEGEFISIDSSASCYELLFLSVVGGRITTAR